MNNTQTVSLSAQNFTTTQKIIDFAIIVDNNKKKIYKNNTIFLDNNTEFKLWFENKTNEAVALKICVNGKQIGNKLLLLRQYETTILDRYLDSQAKYVFSTYNINKKNQNKQQLAENGKIDIYVYCESNTMTRPWVIYPYYVYRPYYTYTSCTTSDTCSKIQALAGVKQNTENLVSSNLIETGRIEHGSNSQQTLEENNSYSFNNFYSEHISFNIKPTSQQKTFLKARDIRIYCTQCGKKRQKQSWKFCPICGTKM